MMIIFSAMGGLSACAEDTAQKANPQSVARVKKVIADLARKPAVSSGTVGFYLAPFDKPNQPLVTRLHRQSFITASTMKTLTTGSALEILGPDFRFETKILHSPSTGDIILQGAGDPSLGRPDWENLFDEWTLALQKAGIQEVNGRVIADESAWESQETPDGWSWLDMGNYYAPPLTPLCFLDNSLQIFFHLSGQPGEPAGFYDAEPWPLNLEFIDEARIGRPGTGDNAYLYGAPGTMEYVIRGTLAADSGKDFIRGALPDPALYCAQNFTAWLNARQIPVHGPATTSRLMEKARRLGKSQISPPTEAKLIGSHFSEPLRDMLIPINHQSLNLDCECLLKTLGEGKNAVGIKRIRDHLASKKLPLAGYEQSDGSGLSRTNMITPELLARANGTFLAGPYGADYLASLATIGQTGSTLRGMKIPPTAVIHAKSGTVERVKSYTGIVKADDGRSWIFAVLVNNYDGSYSRDVAPGMNDLFEALADL